MWKNQLAKFAASPMGDYCEAVYEQVLQTVAPIIAPFLRDPRAERVLAVTEEAITGNWRLGPAFAVSVLLVGAVIIPQVSAFQLMVVDTAGVPVTVAATK